MLEVIDHGSDILIGGISMDRGEAFLRSFRSVGDVFGIHGLNRGVGMPTIKKLGSKYVY